MSMAECLIRAEKVSKHYRLGEETVRANDEVSLEVTAGGFYALTGPSGSGKTTLLDILGCLDTIDSGRGTAFGRDVSRMRESQLVTVRRGNIGFMFQDFMLVDTLTVRENVELGLALSRSPGSPDRVEEIIGTVGLHPRRGHLPKQLSGGERQRAALARALVSSPRVLIADEPTGNLDSRNSEAIYSLFKELNEREGLTIVVATHDAELAARAGTILSMIDGRIVP